MLDDIATWAFWIGILLWQVAAIVSLWLWGGAKRSALGHLAAGVLALVSGTLFIHVTVINVFARMDNAYLGNGIAAYRLSEYFRNVDRRDTEAARFLNLARSNNYTPPRQLETGR